jgi:predicted heme/steroid binding protein
MEDLELKKIIQNHIKDICHISQMQVFATSYYQKNYFQIQIDERINALIDEILHYKENRSDAVDTADTVDTVLHAAEQMVGGREFTLEELAYYDGSGGKEAYVAVNGAVYDMSMKPGWAGGTHFGQYAGKDLTAVFNACHQGRFEFLESTPKIGILKT